MAISWLADLHPFPERSHIHDKASDLFSPSCEVEQVSWNTSSRSGSVLANLPLGIENDRPFRTSAPFVCPTVSYVSEGLVGLNGIAAVSFWFWARIKCIWFDACQFQICFKWNWWNWRAIWKAWWTKDLNLTRNDDISFIAKISNQLGVRWIRNEIWFDKEMSIVGCQLDWYKRLKSSYPRVFSLNFQAYLSFFVWWWKCSPSCPITHLSLLIHVSKTAMRVSGPISSKTWVITLYKLWRSWMSYLVSFCLI
jgi:hypothetical protein